MLTEMDRDIVGGHKRITIPMHDRFILRSVADALRGLCNTLDLYSRMPVSDEMPERLMMMAVGFEIDRINRLIRSTAEQAGIEIKEGRPSKAQIAAERKTAETEMPHNIKMLRE